jgi:hypothetical protein
VAPGVGPGHRIGVLDNHLADLCQRNGLWHALTPPQPFVKMREIIAPQVLRVATSRCSPSSRPRALFLYHYDCTVLRLVPWGNAGGKLSAGEHLRALR